MASGETSPSARARPDRRLRVLEALGAAYSPATGRRVLVLAAVFVLAFGVRALYAVDLAPLMYLPQQPGTRMVVRYHDVALEMMAGEGVLYPRRPDPARTSVMARPPGYSLYLVAIYRALGRSLFAAQLVQNVLTALCCPLLTLLAARLVAWRVGVIAGVLAALSPHLGFASNLVLPDALCAIPVGLAHLAVARAFADPRRGAAWSVAAGAFIGGAAWLRPNAMLLAPFVAAVVFLASRDRRRAAVQGALLTAAAVLVIAPLTIRNYVVFHAFVPVSINGGITVWQGVTDAGGAAYGARRRDMLVAQEEAERYGNPLYGASWAEPDGLWRDRERYRRAREFIATHRLKYARAVAERMFRMVHYGSGEAPLVGRPGAPPPIAIPDTDDEPAGEAADHELGRRKSDDAYLAPGRWMAPLRVPLRAVQQAMVPILLPLLVVGTAILFAVEARAAAVLLSVPAYYLATESFFLLEWRVIVPMHYALFAAAAAPLAALLGWARALFASEPPAHPQVQNP
jgi:hypothetical protein